MFKGIDKALRNNLEVDIFRSGGGLRVVRIEDYKKLKGYGEHPNLKDALRKSSKNYLKKPQFNIHYLTGSFKLIFFKFFIYFNSFSNPLIKSIT